MLDRATDRRCRAGAPMQNLAHSASLHSGEKSAPSNPGTKHLASPFCTAHDRCIRRAPGLLLASLDLLVPLLLLGCVALQALVPLDPLAPRALKRLLRIGGLRHGDADALCCDDKGRHYQL